jgi:hypothetical protein
MLTGFSVPKRILYHNPEEFLSGIVEGMKASDIEERSARAIDKLPDWRYSFRLRISPLTGRLTGNVRNIAGEFEIDFLCNRGDSLWPILIDGEISHFKSGWQKLEDEYRTDTINAALKKYGALPVKRVEYWHLATQRQADRYFRELLV